MVSAGIFDKIDRKDWRNAIIGGVAVGPLPVIATGCFLYAVDRQILSDPQAVLLFGLMSLVAGVGFGATAAAITLVFSVFIRQWPSATRYLISAYEDFAREVDGQLFLSRPPPLFRFLGPSPQRVAFSRHGTNVLLEITSDGIGENTYVYTT